MVELLLEAVGVEEGRAAGLAEAFLRFLLERATDLGGIGLPPQFAGVREFPRFRGEVLEWARQAEQDARRFWEYDVPDVVDDALGGTGLEHRPKHSSDGIPRVSDTGKNQT